MESTTQVIEERQQRNPGGAARLIRSVRKATQRRFTAEDKIRIVLEGFRKEIPVTELCRREKFTPAVYYAWLKTFMEGGKSRLRGDSLREATRNEVDRLKQENGQLKEMAGELALEVSLFKKRLMW